MSTLATFNAAALLRVPESNSIIDSTGRDAAVREAVATFQRHRPLLSVATVAGAGAYDLALPAGWDPTFSELLSVEYPAGEREPVYLASGSYRLYDDGSAPVVRLLEATPLEGEDVRLTYSMPHVVDALGSTIAASDEDALSNLAAAALCEWLSSYYSQITNSTIMTDAVDHKSQATEYALRARRFRILGLIHLGVTEDTRTTSVGSAGSKASDVEGAGLQQDYDASSYQTMTRLTHP